MAPSSAGMRCITLNILLTAMQARTERYAQGRSVTVALRMRIAHAPVVGGHSETQALGRAPAGPITSTVVARRRRRGGVAHQLLDRRQVGAGVEEITGVGPAQVMWRDRW